MSVADYHATTAGPGAGCPGCQEGGLFGIHCSACHGGYGGHNHDTTAEFGIHQTPAPADSPSTQGGGGPAEEVGRPELATWAKIAADLSAVVNSRGKLVDDLWARTPFYVREHAYDNSTTATTVTCQPQTSQPEMIESIIVCTPASATLLLADTQLYFGSAGIFTVSPVSYFLNPGDIRQLVASSAGVLSLTLTGHWLPQWGTSRG